MCLVAIADNTGCLYGNLVKVGGVSGGTAWHFVGKGMPDLWGWNVTTTISDCGAFTIVRIPVRKPQNPSADVPCCQSTMSKAMERRVFLYAHFNLRALLETATQLRHTPCSCDPAQKPRSGSLNWAISLIFDDTVEWIFRSPRESPDVLAETVAELLESEVATMKYVKLHSSIPVPEVFCHSSTGSNAIGISFILMSIAPGFPLGYFSWDPCPEGMISSRKPPPPLKKYHKEKIMRQLGAITAQLYNLRFNSLGSLSEEHGEYRVAKCLSPQLIWHERDSLTIPRGPFQQDYEYYESLLEAFLLHIKELPLRQHAFFAPIPELSQFQDLLSYQAAVGRWNDFVAIGSKIDNSRNRTDYCVAGHFLREMIPLICAPSSASSGFPLCHPDLSTSNIFVDHDFNITCIIDWAFASTVPISTLLATPGLPHPRDEVGPALASIFQDSFTRSIFPGSDGELNSSLWDSSCWARLTTLDGLQDYRYFTELYNSIYQADGDIPQLFKEKLKENEFVELASILAEDDLPASKTRSDEKSYFCMKGSSDEAVARKLTMVSELSQAFVADKRLWRWIEKALDDRCELNKLTAL
ncbi:hypothetical protein V494_02856 [Pseudogymnoascus sp. VKM F-4513 (FW-928)]|nr:hypothetical protein V494_02856 [Pseudogymnoascus sp. VKM F-4513 (FW-928)]